jgi:transcriptional regulator with XRE-family HTH domain
VKIKRMQKYTPIEFDNKKFASEIKAKRTMERQIDLNKLAGETNVSIPTLSRLEHGKMPDTLTFAKVCKWLGKSMDSYIKKVK